MIDREQRELPEGWCWAKLEELVDNPKADIVDGPFGSNLKASEYRESGVPIIRIQNVDRNQFVDKNIRFISPQKATELSRHTFRPGDIVITKLGDPLGKACLVPDAFGPGIIVADLVRLRTRNELISPRYLVFSINSATAAEQLAEHTKGTTRPRVNLDHIRSLQIPLAPFAEQKRIVAKIEELLARVNATRERIVKVPAILKRFRQAVLAAACSGRLTEDWRKNHQCTPVGKSIQEFFRRRGASAGPRDDNLPDLPDTWEYMNSDSLFQFVTSGSRGWAKHYANSGPIFIRVGNLNHESIELDFTNLQHVKPPNNAERERTRVRKGDILISITADVGMVAIVPNNISEAYVNQHVAIARPVDGVNKDYLAWFLAAPTGGQKQFQELQRGATKAGLGLDDIKAVAVPFPPLEEQDEIVCRIHGLFRLADIIGSRLTVAASRITGLTESFLSKAFRGELVITEAELALREVRSFESASELLKRFQRERLKPASIQRKGKGATMPKGAKGLRPAVRRQLVSVLVESKKRLTPDELLRQAGFDEDSVEDFYEELRAGIAAGKITENRPNNAEVYLEAIGS